MSAKPERREAWIAVEPDGTPKRARDGHIPLYDDAQGAATGWCLGFQRPKVERVTIVRRPPPAEARP